ncbi:MAG: hypothetical protein AB1782_16655 [Cyanobacteriota bacterium]
MNIQSTMGNSLYKYALSLIVTGIIAFIFVLLYWMLQVIYAVSGITAVVTFSEYVDLGFRLALFWTLSPIGIFIVTVAIFINPIGQISVMFINAGLTFLHEIGQERGLDFAMALTWPTIDTSTWLNQYATLVTTIKSLLLPSAT